MELSNDTDARIEQLWRFTESAEWRDRGTGASSACQARGTAVWSPSNDSRLERPVAERAMSTVHKAQQ